MTRRDQVYVVGRKGCPAQFFQGETACAQAVAQFQHGGMSLTVLWLVQTDGVLTVEDAEEDILCSIAQSPEMDGAWSAEYFSASPVEHPTAFPSRDEALSTGLAWAIERVASSVSHDLLNVRERLH